MRSEVSKDLAEIRGRWSELGEKKVSALDQLMRTDLKAPQDGVVHQMSVHTVGGLVVPSEPAMLIVPDGDTLAVEVRIPPQEVDSVHVDQDAVLRFPAFNQRVTPEINGHVTRISADVSQDAKTGLSYYTVRVRVPDDERSPPRQGPPRARHAGRGVSSDGRTLRAVLPRQAPLGPGGEGVARALRPSDARFATTPKAPGMPLLAMTSLPHSSRARAGSSTNRSSRKAFASIDRVRCAERPAPDRQPSQIEPTARRARLAMLRSKASMAAADLAFASSRAALV